MPGIKRKEPQGAAGQSPPKKFKKEVGDKKINDKKAERDQPRSKNYYDGKKKQDYTKPVEGKQPVVKEIFDGMWLQHYPTTTSTYSHAFSSTILQRSACETESYRS